MSKRFVFILVLMAAALFGLSACTPCDMVSPDLVSPDWWEVLDPNAATLNWYYSDSSCTPDNFEIILSKDINFSTIEHTGLVAGSASTWTPPVLDDAEEYFWRVRAKDSGNNGPWSLELRSFFTGPICSAGELVSPNLIYPAFGGIYDNAYESLEWSWPLTTCIPASYRVEVSMGSPSFADTTYNGATGTPGTSWGFGSTPPIATQFWWRISAYADGDYGPPSMAKMFWTAPACPGSSLLAPVQESPLDDGIVTYLDPIFTWSYPDSSCTPEGNRILVSDTPDMSSIIFDANSPTIASRAMVSWVTLTDCKEYYWQISAISDGIEGPSSPVHRFVIDTAGACDCTEITLPVPIMIRPTYFEVFPDINAIIRWNNLGGCFEEGVSIKLDDHPFYEETTLDQYFTGDFITGYDPPFLDPATQYWTKVAFAVEDGGTPYIGTYSSGRTFLTGPECTSLADLAAPVLDLPADGAVVDTLTPLLRYHPGAPGCIPDGYFINLQTDPAFGGISLLGAFPQPSTAVITDPLTDCTMYYLKVNANQSGAGGPESTPSSFLVNESGACLPPGVPGTAKSSNFCREGTFELFEAKWTVVEGDRVLAIARNPLTTYLKLTILDQETKQPFKHEIQCWSYIGNYEPGWPETPEGMQYFFEDLPVENPPPTPVPTEIPVCHEKLEEEDCIASGGTYTYDSDKHYCHCP